MSSEYILLIIPVSAVIIVIWLLREMRSNNPVSDNEEELIERFKEKTHVCTTPWLHDDGACDECKYEDKCKIKEQER